MTDKKDSKTISFISVPTDVFSWVVQGANIRGLRVSEFCGILLERMKLIEGTPLSENAATIEFDGLQKIKELERRRQMLLQTASIHMVNPTEESAELLKDMIERSNLDISFQEVMQIAGSHAFKSIVADAKTDTMLGQCILWLANTMSQHKKILSNDIFKLGARNGYNERMIKRAKAEIANSSDDSYTIVSSRIGNAWSWEVITKEEDETYNQLFGTAATGQDIIPN